MRGPVSPDSESHLVSMDHSGECYHLSVGFKWFGIESFYGIFCLLKIFTLKLKLHSGGYP